MQTVVKYRETLLFVSCVTLLVGTVMVLQKATTPSRHRRRTSSSASRAGTAARSASHGPAAARSRSSSRPRIAHLNNNTHNSAAPATATAIERSHGAKGRDLSQAHAHRHHPYSRNGGMGGDGAVSRMEGADASSAPRLTVEAVAQHKRALGTASALQDPGHSELAGIHAPRRVVSSSGYRVNGGSGSCEEGAYYRSASNAATVGSQAPCPAPALAAAVAESTRGAEKAYSAATNVAGWMSPRLSPPVGDESVCFDGAHVRREAKVDCSASPQAGWGLGRAQVSSVCAPISLRVTTTQTNPRWFCEDRGTQTETHVGRDGVKTAASGTPDRWLAAAMMSPIIPAGEDANDSTTINCADLGWTPVQEGAASAGIAVHADTLACKDSQPFPRQNAEPVVIPRYFLQQLEQQLRQLVDDVAQDACNERAWMCLYTYLSELPLMVRRALTVRDRCGAATVAQLVDRVKSSSRAEGNLVEETVRLPDKEGVVDLIPSLPRDVLHLLQHCTAVDPEFHFEWRGSTVAYVEGPFGDSSRKVHKSTEIGSREADALTPERIPSSSLSAKLLMLTDNEEEKLSFVDDEEAVCISSILSFLAAHIRKYSDGRRRGAATQFPEPGTEELRTPPGITDGTHTGAYALSTPPNNRQRDADAALLQQYRDQQQHLVSLVASFVELRQSALFQALRHTQQHALFACDFIELASTAERQLERVSRLPDAPLLMEIPVTQKRLMTASMDIHETSLGTNTSLGSGSSPTTGLSARHGAKVGTPRKPSIRHPIQRIVSN
ncbi:hypothetical protein LSCM1_01817 [Leishmania martiniquensis]|uniref:Uncharacterized protein n=1 Tax=Leishmania martiniquensis TaxID=1580590 RepID=A0A836KLY3_9TRYP|nr:hypothetical protein LSCM1_01817 [Leishmania martiniquensis]